jgi:DNA-binding NtrC family response regulator
LIEGETGVGKEIVAQKIHDKSKRSNNPYIGINCTAIPYDIAESELFGHEKGAFTSATYKKYGKFEIVRNGTLLLDEIGDMLPALQSKLLRVLEEKIFYRVGGINPIKFNARIIVTTNKILHKEVNEQRFRRDLYYRLCEFTIKIPPLRERKEDIPVLIEYFLRQINQRYGIKKKIHSSALEVLINYKWEGNIRELRNVVKRAAICAKNEEITPEDIKNIEEECREKAPNTFIIPFDKPLNTIQRYVIYETIKRCNNNKRMAAKILGISEATLYRKLRRFEKALID